MESQNNLIELLAEAADHEIEFLRCGRLIDSALSEWEIARELFGEALRNSTDQEAIELTEKTFAGSCFANATLLEQIGPRYEQAFDLACTHYELAMREQQEHDPARVSEIRQMLASFKDLPTKLSAAAERVNRSADNAGTLAVTAALYPPNSELQSALLRSEGLMRGLISIYRSVRERNARLMESI